MKIPKKAIVSNSDIIKNYKTLRDRTEVDGKLFIFKNNQPDAVLFSITEYERFAEIIELIEHMSEEEIHNLLKITKEYRHNLLVSS